MATQDESSGDANADEPLAPNIYTCPNCQQEVDLAALGAGPFVVCPHCGSQFFLPTDEPEESEEEESDEEEELSALRIRQVSRARRALIRSRSYMLVAYFGCLGGSAELIYLSIQSFRWQHHVNAQMVGYIFFALALLIPAGFFYRRGKVIGAELKTPLLEEPAEPPDLSTLQDGSQHWKNLHKMR